jgi:hypothetical protein
VNDSLFVGSGESLPDLAGDVQGFPHLERARLDFLTEALSFHVAHHDEGVSVRFVNLVDGTDVWIVQGRRCLGFVEKPLLGFLVCQ